MFKIMPSTEGNTQQIDLLKYTILSWFNFPSKYKKKKRM